MQQYLDLLRKIRTGSGCPFSCSPDGGHPGLRSAGGLSLIHIFSLPTADEWASLCGGGCRTLFPWGDGLDYSMRLRWFEDMDEDENRSYDMEAVSYTHLVGV